MNKKEFSDSLRCAGGFIAWMIGPGFATGQELLQFFCGCGYAVGCVYPRIGYAGLFFIGGTLVKGLKKH